MQAAIAGIMSAGCWILGNLTWYSAISRLIAIGGLNTGMSQSCVTRWSGRFLTTIIINICPPHLLVTYRDPIITGIQSGEVGFIEFIKKQKLSNFFSDYLCGVNPDEFALVGFLDEYRGFTTRLSELLEIEIKPEMRMRQSEADPPAADYEEAKKLLSPDYCVYEAFRKRWAEPSLN